LDPPELRPFRLGTSYETQLAGLAVPTLLLHGRNDRVVPSRKAVKGRGTDPGCEVDAGVRVRALGDAGSARHVCGGGAWVHSSGWGV